MQMFSREEFLTSVCLVSILQGKKIVLFGLPVSALSVGFLDVYESYIYILHVARSHLGDLSSNLLYHL